MTVTRHHMQSNPAVCTHAIEAVRLIEGMGFTVAIGDNVLEISRPTRAGQFQTRYRVCPYADGIGFLVRYGDLLEATA